MTKASYTSKRRGEVKMFYFLYCFPLGINLLQEVLISIDISKGIKRKVWKVIHLNPTMSASMSVTRVGVGH